MYVFVSGDFAGLPQTLIGALPLDPRWGTSLQSLKFPPLYIQNPGYRYCTADGSTDRT